MAKFEIKAVMRRNNKNLRITEGLLHLLAKTVPSYRGWYLCVEFDRSGKSRFTKRKWINGQWESVDL